MDTIPVAPSRALLQPLEVPPSRAGIRWDGPWSPATALLLVVLPLAGYLGFRSPSGWAVTLESVSLTDGFHRRFLVGTVLRPFAALFGYHYAVYALAAFAVLGMVLTVAVVAFFRTSSVSRRFLIIGWLLLPTGGYLFHEVGYLDQVLYLVLFAALWALHRNRPVSAAALLMASVLAHEIALLTVVPIFGVVLLRKLPFRKACAVLAPSAAAGLVVLTVPPAEPGAVQRFQQVLADAGFPYRDDALGLFDRTQAQSWQLYSITDVLLYLLPILLVVVAGFLMLHRPSSATLLPLAAVVAPVLLAFGGWDEARWGFLLITNFVLVLWLRQGRRELDLPRFGALAAILLVLTHLPLPYFDGYRPRDVTLVGPPHPGGNITLIPPVAPHD
ncbi:hypothetical protein AB0L41_23125 [Amycolatopsis mediterranei]|uniref:hypothetical protein n=1 Tax=Amycolatopsis mediterranei TaxID=33910 RepID=UPI00341355A0